MPKKFLNHPLMKKPKKIAKVHRFAVQECQTSELAQLLNDLVEAGYFVRPDNILPNPTGGWLVVVSRTEEAASEPEA